MLTGPDQTMAVATSLALAGSCSELAGLRVTDVVVTHSEGCLLAHSLKPRLSVKVCSFGPLNLHQNMAGFNFRRRIPESFLPGASAWPPRDP